MISIIEVEKLREKAIMSPVKSVDDFNDKWRSPTALRCDKKRSWLLVLMVGFNKEIYEWSLTIQMCFTRTGKVKKPSEWSVVQTQAASELIAAVMTGLGDGEMEVIAKHNFLLSAVKLTDDEILRVNGEKKISKC